MSVNRRTQPAGANAHREFEQIVVSALRASHVAPVVAAQGQDKRADLAAWVDELDSLGLNLLPIELKLRASTAPRGLMRPWSKHGSICVTSTRG